MKYVRIDPFTGKVLGFTAGPRPDRTDIKDIENIFGDLTMDDCLELDASDGTGEPTGRVFRSSHTSESVKAECITSAQMTAVRHYVEDLDSDRGTWTAAEAEIEATYHRLKDRVVPIECSDPASGYQLFIGLLRSEGIIASDAERDAVILGTLLRTVTV